MKSTIELTFRGIDRFNRPVFKDNKRNYYGSVNKLYSYDATKEEVEDDFDTLDLCYFGRSFGCEPEGYGVSERLVLKK